MQRAFPLVFGAKKDQETGFSILAAVFDSRASFFAPKPHGNACYAGNKWPRDDVSFFLLSVTTMCPSRQRALTSERYERSVKRKKKC